MGGAPEVQTANMSATMTDETTTMTITVATPTAHHHLLTEHAGTMIETIHKLHEIVEAGVAAETGRPPTRDLRVEAGRARRL